MQATSWWDVMRTEARQRAMQLPRPSLCQEFTYRLAERRYGVVDEPHRWPFARMTPTETSTVVVRSRVAPDVGPPGPTRSAPASDRAALPRHHADGARQRDRDAGGDTGVARLFEELVGLLERGHELDERTIDRSIGMVRDERPTEVLTHEVLRGAKGRHVRPKTAGQKRYVEAIRDNIITFGTDPRAPASRGWR